MTYEEAKALVFKIVPAAPCFICGWITVPSLWLKEKQVLCATCWNYYFVNANWENGRPRR